MPANASEPGAHLARLGVFWLGIQAVWGAILAISLQARTIELGGARAILAFGLVSVTGAGVAAIVQIASGVLSDRRRARGGDRVAFYVAGAAIGSVGILWFYLAPTFVQLIAGYALVQLGLNVAMGAYQAIIPDAVLAERTGRASSWMAGLQSVGNAIGAIVATLVADARVVAGALVALLLATCAATSTNLRLRPLPSADASVRRAPPSKTYIDLFVSRLLLYAGFYTLVDYLYFYVVVAMPGAGSSRVKLVTGIALLTFTACGAIGALVAARPSDGADKRLVVSLGGASFAVAMVCLIASGGVPALEVVAGCAGAAWGVVLAADWALACRMLPGRTMATAMAVWNLAVLLAQIAAPALTSAVLGRASILGPPAPRLAFAVAALLILAGIAWIWRLPKGFARE